MIDLILTVKALIRTQATPPLALAVMRRPSITDRRGISMQQQGPTMSDPSNRAKAAIRVEEKK
jgi:hypothetical protein